MRPPTNNPITQTKHGRFNAVDYSYRPDDTIYAPEDGTVAAYYLNAGDAGNNLQIDGKNGRHGFCHLEQSYVQVGDRVAKGQPIGRMGCTGLTIPPGKAGTHLHWVLKRGNEYVYPPDYVTEPFGGEDMATEEILDILWHMSHGVPPNAADKRKWLGKPTNEVIVYLANDGNRHQYVKRINAALEKFEQIQKIARS